MSKSILTLFLAVALVSAAALGADTTWTHVDPNDVWTGEWSDASNWDIGVPGAGDDAYLTNTLGSYVVNMNGVASKLGRLILSNAVGKTVTLNLNANLGWDDNWAFLDIWQGGIVNVNGKYRLGLPDEGHLRGGKLVVNDGGELYLRTQNKAGSQRNLWIRSGAEVIVEEGGTLYWHWVSYILYGADVQTTVRGLFNMTSGDATMQVGWCTSQTAEFRVEGNGVVEVKNQASYIRVGVAGLNNHGHGLFTLTDSGTVTNKGTLFLAKNDKKNNNRSLQGVVNIEGGQWYNDGRVQVAGWEVTDSAFEDVNTSAAAFNANMKGTITQSDGLFRALADVYVANGPSTGLLNLEGGQFYVTNLTGDATLYVGSTISADKTLTSSGVATLRMNGGFLRADKIVGTQGEDFTNVEFLGGTVETGSTELVLEKRLMIGDGTQAAMLNLLGGEHRFDYGLQVNGNATLKGTGTIDAPKLTIESDGTLAPGSSPGLLELENGALELKSGSIFEVEIGGPDPGTDYDSMAVLNGTAILAGELRVKFINGFENDVIFFDTFEVLSSSGTMGNFSNLHGGRVAVYGGPGSFEVDVSGGSVRLLNYVIPEPASTAMLLVGGLALMLRRRLRARSR